MTFRNRCLGGVTLLSLLAFADPIAATAARSAKKIEGTWLIQITAVKGDTGAELGNFSSLYSFAEGGTLTNVTTGASPAVRSPGLGAWEKTGAYVQSGEHGFPVQRRWRLDGDPESGDPSRSWMMETNSPEPSQ